MENSKATERPFKKNPDVKVWEIFLEVDGDLELYCFTNPIHAAKFARQYGVPFYPDRFTWKKAIN